MSGRGLLWADSIDELRGIAVSRLPTGFPCLVSGYWSRDDGGGGLFLWDAASTAPELVPDPERPGAAGLVTLSVKPSSIASGNPGRWARLVLGEEYNVRWFGARGDATWGIGGVLQGTDDSRSFKAAIEAMQTRFDAYPDVGTPKNAEFGRTLLVPPGRYRIGSTIVINRCLRMTGVSNRGASDSQLLVERGITAILIAGPPRASAPPSGRYGTDSIVENLGITASQDTSSGRDSRNAHGIHLTTRATVQNVVISYFGGDGIRIDGSGDNNANLWRVDSCRLIGNGVGYAQPVTPGDPRPSVDGGNGLCVFGRNAQVGVAIGLDLELNRNWAIYEHVDYGNTYVGCHADGNGSTPDYGGPYRVANPNSRSLFVGCYTEEGQNPSDFSESYAVWLWGSANAADLKAGSYRWDAWGTQLTFVGARTNPHGYPTLTFSSYAGQTMDHMQVRREPPPGVLDNPQWQRFAVTADGRLAVGNEPPGPACGVHLSCSSGDFVPLGLRMFKVTRSQRNQMPAEAGLIVYNADSSRLNIFDGSQWLELLSGPVTDP